MNKIFKHKYISLIIVGIFLFIGYNVYSRINRVSGDLDAFAQCLKDKGAKFYGASWCPHCQDQKKMFGTSVEFLPYIECAIPGGQGTSAICKKAEIKGYPTWVFADGSRKSGKLELSELAEKTGCNLPSSNNK